MEATPRESELKKYLDACFLPLGFTHTKGMAGENYVREEDGRTIKVHCSRRKRTKYAGDIRYSQYAGHVLEITVTPSVQTRFNIGKTTAAATVLAKGINRIARSKPVHAGEAYKGYEVSASEPAWAEEFLQKPQVRSAVTALIPPDTEHVAGFRFSPVGCAFTQRLPISDITPEKTALWLENTLRLVEIAEANPPMDTINPNWLERQTPLVSGLVIVGALLAFFVGMGLCCSLVLVLISIASTQ